VLLLQPASSCRRLISPFAPAISYVGRVQPTSNNQGAQFDWSGIRIKTNFTGSTSVLAKFTDNQNEYDIFLNGQLIGILNTTTNQSKVYPVASGLDPTKYYQVALVKRTEALFGIATFEGFILTVDDDSNDVECPDDDHYRDSILHHEAREPARKIEFIGDSISCGYGIDDHIPCHFSASTENSDHTYGAIISRNLKAELFLECWSGMGVVRNYGDKNQTSPDPFPVYYPRTLANDPLSSWDFSWVPRAVVINLGTNDYSTQPQPTAEQFETGYNKFIANIKAWYSRNPGLRFFLACGPLIFNPCCEYVKAVAMSNGPNFHFIDMQGILQYPADYGCDYHPNIEGHKKMAAVAQPIIKAAMGW